jgi:NADH-quinone oxidoreductase subunit H
LKDPVQQKTLVGAAILLMLVGVPFLIDPINTAIIGLFWFMFKVGVIVYIMIWFRGTFPRFRYDQLMDIGWKYMIPIGIGSLVVNAILGMTR